MLPVPRLYGGPKPGPSFVCAQDRESVGRVVGWLGGLIMAQARSGKQSGAS